MNLFSEFIVPEDTLMTLQFFLSLGQDSNTHRSETFENMTRAIIPATQLDLRNHLLKLRHITQHSVWQCIKFVSDTCGSILWTESRVGVSSASALEETLTHTPVQRLADWRWFLLHYLGSKQNWIVKRRLAILWNIPPWSLVGVYWRLGRSRDSAVGITTGYGLDDRGGRSSSPGRVKNFLQVVETGSGAHPASYPMDVGGSFPGG
jgi:hypothetical protein